MTEEEWLASLKPGPMIEELPEETTDRKLRLFAVACCRRIWHLLSDERSRNAVVCAEEHAEGLRSGEDLERALAEACKVEPLHPDATAAAARAAMFVADPSSGNCAYFAAACAAAAKTPSLPVEEEAQAHLLRDIIRHISRTISIDPAILAWNNGTVVKLAQAIYDERAFDRLPILADALEDAGCHDQDILAHCRGPGPHVRGCWVVDLMLSKE